MKWIDWIQKIYDWLKNPPRWLVILCETVGKIIFGIFQEATKAYIAQIEAKIIEMKNVYPNLSGEEKFNLVWDFAHTLLPAWKESRLDTLIQNLYIKLKEEFAV